MTSLQILGGRHLERTQDILKAAIHDNSSLDGGLLSLLEISEDIDLLKSKITSVSGLWNIIVKLVNATSTMDVVPVVYDVALRMKTKVVQPRFSSKRYQRHANHLQHMAGLFCGPSMYTAATLSYPHVRVS